MDPQSRAAKNTNTGNEELPQDEGTLSHLSSWNPFAHLALFFKLRRYPPSEAVLTPGISPISGRFVEGGSILFLPVQVQRTCPLPARKELYISYKDHITNKGSPCKALASNQTTQPQGHRKETKTDVVWTYLSFIRCGQNHLARHSERGKKTRQTEEVVGRHRQGMDRPEVRQVPGGSGEQRKMEETGCEVICGAPTTFVIKGQVKVMLNRTV